MMLQGGEKDFLFTTIHVEMIFDCHISLNYDKLR